MTCRTVRVGSEDLRFCPDDAPAAANRLRAVIRARMLDEITGAPPNTSLSVTSGHEGLAARASSGGVVGLAGFPGPLFPDLAAGGIDLWFRVGARRYLPRRLEGTLGPIAGFPDAFAPADLGDVALHREAVTLLGRVVRAGSLGSTALAGATVSVTESWENFPPAAASVPASGNFLLAVAPGCYAERAAGAIVRSLAMTPAAGEEKELRDYAGIGAQRVRLSDGLNLSIGDVLALDPDQPDLAEYVLVTGLDPAVGDDQPCSVDLAHALAREHRPGAVCVRAAPSPAGVDNALEREAIPGDRTVFLSALTDIAAGEVVEINGGGPDPEFQVAAFYEATSGADGYFRLPPLARVAQVTLRAQWGGIPDPLEKLVSPDYESAEYGADMVFPAP